MEYGHIWEEVIDLPDTAMLQVPGSLSDVTKKEFEKLDPASVGKIVLAAIEEVNHGSIAPLDQLISKRLRHTRELALIKNTILRV